MNKKAEFKVEGEVLIINETQTFASGFRKREVVIETSKGNRPSPVKVTFKGEDVEKPDSLNEGDGVSVEGFVDGREYNGNFYIDLNVRSCMVTEKSAKAASKPSKNDGEKPTKAASWGEFLELAIAYGETKETATERAKAFGNGRKASEYKPDEWQRIADALVAEKTAKDASAETTAADDDDMPF